MNRVVSIYPPVGFTNQGRRDNNEDYVVPLPGRATHYDRLFVVCDGVGGAQRGEVASLIAGESLRRFASQHPDAPIDSTFVREALLFTEAAFDRAIADESEANLAGMSTTMTLLSLHERGVTIAHVGDSRVYHVREGQILHQTDDHSLVNELVRTRQITPEEAATHPRRNVITRAIQGSTNPTAATVYVTQDVAPDDYFFLCTDGVLESIDAPKLIDLLDDTIRTDQEKVDAMMACCAEKSNDNYSGYLIRVADVEPLTAPLMPADEVPATEPEPMPGSAQESGWEAEAVAMPLRVQAVPASVGDPMANLLVEPTVTPVPDWEFTAQDGPMPEPLTHSEHRVLPVVHAAASSDNEPVMVHDVPDPEVESALDTAVSDGQVSAPDSFQLLADDDAEADKRWRRAENRSWFQRLFS